jgi:hypothetical protein
VLKILKFFINWLNFILFYISDFSIYVIDSFFIQRLDLIINMTPQILHLSINICQTLHQKRFNISELSNHIISYQYIIALSKVVKLITKLGIFIFTESHFVVDVGLHSFFRLDPHFFNIYFQFIFCSVYSKLHFVSCDCFTSFYSCLILIFN